MKDQNAAMATLITALEQELKRLNWWQNEPPSPTALASVEPFCVDTLTFSQWLQWVFIPKVQMIIAAGGQLPAKSGLLPIAQEAWKNCAEVEALMTIVETVDALFNDGHLQEV